MVVVLLLVVLAAGVLVGAVGVGEPAWGWISVLLSVLGAALLVAERRRRRRAGPAAGPEAEPAPGTDRQPTVVGPEPVPGDPDENPITGRSAESAASGGTALLGRDSVADRDRGGTATPAATTRWEQPPAPDPDAQVLVVDEYPRYHLPDCPWLRDRETIGLPFREAQELGFTPCARCAPYATLAGRAGGR
nr:hypothetical protein [Saccharopolyspora sp. HNM0983]